MKKEILDVVKNKKYQWIATVVVFLIILLVGLYIRYQPISTGHLVDETTGDYTPLALDPYYFLRVSETLVANNGTLPDFDTMRSPHLDVAWTQEILPQANVLLFNFLKVFDPSVTLNYADVFSPVLFFALGLIVFFLLSYLLTKSKIVSLFASFVLVVIPPYLYRTLAGFSDHEAIGILGFFLALLVFFYGIFFLDKEKKKKNAKYKIGLVGLLAGIATTFAVVSWGGGASFLFMILPVAFLVKWFIEERKNKSNYILFYGAWIIGVILGGILFNISLTRLVSSYMLGNTGILTLFALLYFVAETLTLKYYGKNDFVKKYIELISIVIVVLISGILYQIFVGDFFSMIAALLNKIIYPFGTARVAVTVAENKQPYLTDLTG